MNATKWALETVLEFAEKWADGKRRDREAFDEAAPILRAALSKPVSIPQAEGQKALAAEIAAAESRGRAEEREAAANVCDALSESPAGNSYGNIGNAYDECAAAIRARARGSP